MVSPGGHIERARFVALHKQNKQKLKIYFQPQIDSTMRLQIQLNIHCVGQFVCTGFFLLFGSLFKCLINRSIKSKLN